MATQRKSASRSRTARPVKKSAGASKTRAKAASGTKRPAPKAQAKPATATSAKGKPAPAKTSAKAKPPVIAKRVIKAVVLKPGTKLPNAKLPPGKKGQKRPAVTEVRPLGVLPPGSRARGSDRAPAPVASRVHAVPPKPPTPTTRPQGAQRVTEKDMKEFEDRLLTERGRILKEMGHLENTVLKVNPRDSAGDLSGYSFHMADAGTDAMEREKAFLFASSEGRSLMEINAALRRLYNGEYGVCESCGLPIARARLEAMPHARLCVSCKEKEERASRNAQ
jgi:RNA polymerase-binding transcription factor